MAYRVYSILFSAAIVISSYYLQDFFVSTCVAFDSKKTVTAETHK